MNKEAMRDALRARKARGLDLTIVMGMPNHGAEPMQGSDEQQEKEQKEMGLAPEATEIKDGDKAASMDHADMRGDMGHGYESKSQHLQHPVIDEKNVGMDAPGKSAAAPHDDEAQDRQLIDQELQKMGMGKNSVHGKTHAKYAAKGK